MGGEQGGSTFFKLAFDQVADGIDDGVFIVSIGGDGDDRSMAGGKHHQAHDAFPINFLAVFFDKNIGLKSIRDFHELSGRSGMDAEFVEDGEIFFNHEEMALAGATLGGNPRQSKSKVWHGASLGVRRSVACLMTSISSGSTLPRPLSTSFRHPLEIMGGISGIFPKFEFKGLPRMLAVAFLGVISPVFSCPDAQPGENPRPALRFHPMSESIQNASFQQIGDVLQRHQSFVLLSHVRPDGDAIGSQIALGFSLMAAGKSVRLFNEDGLPDSLTFLPGSDRIEVPPADPVDAEVVIALDTATRPRLGERCLHAASKAKLWLNIDHHISNPKYGDLNLIDATSPATGEILYELIIALGLPLPDESRDALYVAVSTDTGSFQYPSTTAKTYDMAADLIRRGLDVGTINSNTYDNRPFRRLELLRTLLNTLELSPDGLVAHWTLREKTRHELSLCADDSEGLIDVLRAIRGVQVAVFFEELPDGKTRISMRSKDRRYDVCQIASEFGGGGHSLAAGIRMKDPLDDAKPRVLAAIQRRIAEAPDRL